MSDFVPETEEDNDDEPMNVGETAKITASFVPAAKKQKLAEVVAEPEFSRRMLNEKWYGRYGDDGDLLEFSNNEWKPVDSEEAEFLSQLWFEQDEQEKKARENYNWNEEKQEWEPKAETSSSTNPEDINEDFIAQYQSNYGVQYDDIYKKMDEELLEKTAKVIKENEEKKEKKEQKKKKKLGKDEEQKPEGWVDLGDKVHAVYVQNIPIDLTDEEFQEFMSKCGVIQPDARTNKPKIKLYRDEHGELKGDGRCCYIRKESVDLACSILDGAILKGKQVSVEEARFEQKGDFDPTKKKRKLTAAQKKRYMDQQNKIFEWKPDKPRNYRPPSDCTVIVKNLFTLDMMMKNAALMLDLKEEMEQSCQKYGTVKKVVVYDNHPEGVVSVAFTNTDESDMAVKFLNGRVVDGRELTAEIWDGRTKYKIQETAEDEEKRRIAYEKYISGEGEKEEKEEDDGEEE